MADDILLNYPLEGNNGINMMRVLGPEGRSINNSFSPDALKRIIEGHESSDTFDEGTFVPAKHGVGFNSSRMEDVVVFNDFNGFDRT